MEKVIFGAIGGLGLFLFGMKHLSDALQMVSGTKIRRLMRSLTGNRLKGLALGAIITSIVQSSSVTTVILIGLINAGIVSLMQSAAVIFGANIGTSITAQIIAFKVTKYALPAIALGFGISMLAKRKKTQSWGHVVLALGLIFLGLSTMSGVLKPLKDLPVVVDFLVNLGQNPFLGISLGAIVTMLIQSSSASIGMILALATIGLIDFQAALYLVLGSNIGTTVTAWLASLSGNISAKRMAFVHSLFNIIGSAYIGFFVYTGAYAQLIDWITPGPINVDTIGRNIANAHSVFNVINAFIFLPFIGLIVKLAQKVIPGEDVFVSDETQYLQDSLLASPEIAVESAYKEITYMSGLSLKAFQTSMDGFFSNNKKSVQHVASLEDAVDSLQTDITFYLSKLSTKELTSEMSNRIPRLLHTINDIERISDHATNIANITERKIASDFTISKISVEEIKELYKDVQEMFRNTIKTLEQGDKLVAREVLAQENQINKDYRRYINNNLERFGKQECDPIANFIFVDMMHNLEKIADHLTNIVQACLGQTLLTEQLVYEELVS